MNQQYIIYIVWQKEIEDYCWDENCAEMHAILEGGKKKKNKKNKNKKKVEIIEIEEKREKRERETFAAFLLYFFIL